jgi:hypothetical protein
VEAIDPVVMNDRDLAFRCAALNADRGFKEIVRRMKADVLERWANEKDNLKRELLWHEMQTVQKLADRVQALAEEKTMILRKVETAKRRRTQPGAG